MIRAATVAAVALVAAAVAAQTVKDPENAPEGETPTAIPEIQAGTDPMNWQPDPPAGAPAAKSPPQPSAPGKGQTECRVRRADTDTGFVVVCEERR